MQSDHSGEGFGETTSTDRSVPVVSFFTQNPNILTPVNYSTYCTYYASVVRTLHVVSKEVTVRTYVLAKGV